MLSRTLLIFASATLGACNPVVSAPLDIANLGRVIGSYAHSLMDTLGSSIGNHSTRPKRLDRETVRYGGNEPPGTIVVRTNERRLYFVLADNKAIRYPVGVGRIGKQWQGRAEIDGAYVQPAWSPTAEMKRENPTLPSLIPGGAPNNPMGARALTLSGGKYAIHGTNRPESVGRDASYGCLRMFNDHIIDLYGRVSVGTKVIVTRGS
jgi:lipoprotein-anchoring transpeptidase ErfK/SrfK